MRFDVAIVGAGHNGLVAATLLARKGLSVGVFEARDTVGGAARTERPFAKAPGVGASTGAYLLGPMPPEVLEAMDVRLPLLRRDPHYFLPTLDGRYLLFGSDTDAMRAQFQKFFSEQDWRANQALQSEIAQLREDIAPSWLLPPVSIEATAERFVRPALRDTFIQLCRGTVGAYLERFEFQSDLLKAMYAVTDGFTGLDGGWDTPGSGMNFLLHNMCRLPGASGTWMVCEGGMGTVTQSFATAASEAGATIVTNAPIERIETSAGAVERLHLKDGRQVQARAIVINADPFSMLNLVDLPGDFVQELQGKRRGGTTMKVNFCLDRLPEFSCLKGDHGQYQGTIHLLPPEETVIADVKRALADVHAGRLPAFPTIEWYIHSTVDPSLQDEAGRHTAALFVQWVPHTLADSSWDAEETRYVEHLFSIVDRFAPGTSDRVVDTFVLTPPKIESHFGIHRGHIHHLDNTYGFDERLPFRLPLDGLYACGAGCHPGGSVIGAAGLIAANLVGEDLRAS